MSVGYVHSSKLKSHALSYNNGKQNFSQRQPLIAVSSEVPC